MIFTIYKIDNDSFWCPMYVGEVIYNMQERESQIIIITGRPQDSLPVEDLTVERVSK